MQNEELRKTQAHLKESMRQYYKLYENAPIGYLTVDKNSSILRANLKASTLLHKERDTLINTQFRAYIIREDADRKAFYSHLKMVFKNKTGQVCLVRLKEGRDVEFCAKLYSVPVYDLSGNMRSIISINSPSLSQSKMTASTFQRELTFIK